MKKVVLVLSLIFCSCENTHNLDKLSWAYPDMYAQNLGKGYYALYDKNHNYKYMVTINDQGYPQIMAVADTTKPLPSMLMSVDHDYCMSPRKLE